MQWLKATTRNKLCFIICFVETILILFLADELISLVYITIWPGANFEARYAYYGVILGRSRHMLF
jgi:hypothetical protein